ncbi:hypothetical protein Tco_0802893 [Tanacetum coccineum]|uniref:Uncharacterized protein n=1 Tax=Tanacetum coccineum TaxID=301880 RepID=A0ABQ5A032_9ASTR
MKNQRGTTHTTSQKGSLPTDLYPYVPKLIKTFNDARYPGDGYQTRIQQIPKVPIKLNFVIMLDEMAKELTKSSTKALLDGLYEVSEPKKGKKAEDEKGGEYVISEVFYGQQTNTKSDGKDEDIVLEYMNDPIVKVDPVTPKSATLEPPRAEQRVPDMGP